MCKFDTLIYWSENSRLEDILNSSMVVFPGWLYERFSFANLFNSLYDSLVIRDR